MVKKIIENSYIIPPNQLDTHQQRKQVRIRQVAIELARRKKITTNSLIAILDFNGLRKTLAEEYINTLIALGWAKHEGKYLIWCGPEALPQL